MSNMKYNRPIHQQIDDRKHTLKQIDKMPMGNSPVIYNDTMRFGKYKGKRYGEIPTSYLEWLVSITSDDTQALKYCKELEKRPKYQDKKEPPNRSLVNDESHSVGVYRLKKLFNDI